MNRIRLAGGLIALALASCVDWKSPIVAKSLQITDPPLTSRILDVTPGPSGPDEGPLRAVFERVNADREAEGLSPVSWDPAAAELAAAYTRRQIEDATIGHFLTDGMPPYARAARRGIFGVGSENAAAFFSVDGLLEDAPTTLLLRAEEEMLSEKSPNDGHRRAILDPDATHVGIGWHQSATDFRMVEEFFCRRFAKLSIASSASGAGVVIRGTSAEDESLEYIGVAREPIPKSLSRAEILRRRSYSYPSPTRAVVPASSFVSYGGLRTERLLTLSFERRFTLHYDMDEPGLWTFILYFRHARSKLPPRPGGSMTVMVERKPEGA